MIADGSHVETIVCAQEVDVIVVGGSIGKYVDVGKMEECLWVAHLMNLQVSATVKEQVLMAWVMADSEQQHVVFTLLREGKPKVKMIVL